MKTIKVTLPANLNYSSLIRHIADEVFADAQFSKAWRSRLKLVVDELFMNAVRYGSTQDESSVYATFEYDAQLIRFTIEDDGTGQNAISADELKAIIQKNQDNKDLTRTSGRGLAMITKLWTDEVTLQKSQYGGISVTFTKALETAQKAPPSPPLPTGPLEQMVNQPIPPKAPAPPATAAPAPTQPAPAPTQPAPVPTPAQPAPAAPPPKGPTYEVKLSGEIDQSNIDEKVAPVYEQANAMPEGSTLVLDFADLEYINSTFIGNLASWYNTAQQKKGRICLKNVNKEIREVLSLVGLLEILECPVS